MYLRGLQGCTQKQFATADPSYCQLTLRGSWSGSYSVNGQPNMGICTYTECFQDAPSAASAPANITVTVPTNTTVSPQISPQFIQQQQPTNSPIGAALTGPTQGADSDYLRKLADEETARQNAIIDALRTQQQTPSQVVVPNTTASADASRAMTDQPQQSSFFSTIPVLPILLLIAAGAGIVVVATHKRKGERHSRRRKLRRGR